MKGEGTVLLHPPLNFLPSNKYVVFRGASRNLRLTEGINTFAGGKMLFSCLTQWVNKLGLSFD
jgi:hypothetical protein